MQNLLIFQSLWAMERRQTDGLERTLEENVAMIAAAGYDGISTHCTDAAYMARVDALCAAHELRIEGQCFPKTVDDLKHSLALAVQYDIQHLDVQPDVRPRSIEDCIPLLDGWLELSAAVDVPVLIETHRDRMTTDLYFMLDLLDKYPDLPLLADISHYLVGREFAWPVAAENHAMIQRILDNAWVFHGRVASREQVQIEISFPQHQRWVELFAQWWTYGFRSWQQRAGSNDSLIFTCELGPQPYAISGPDGNDTTDRWAEALMLRDIAQTIWNNCHLPDWSFDAAAFAATPSGQ